MNSALILSKILICKNPQQTVLKWLNFQQKWLEKFQNGLKPKFEIFDYLHYRFPTSCKVRYDILVKKSISKRFKQPWIAMKAEVTRKFLTIYFSYLQMNSCWISYHENNSQLHWRTQTGYGRIVLQINRMHVDL